MSRHGGSRMRCHRPLSSRVCILKQSRPTGAGARVLRPEHGPCCRRPGVRCFDLLRDVLSFDPSWSCTHVDSPLLHAPFDHSSSTTGPRRRRSLLWALEGLEGRVLLSGNPTYYTVNLTSDTGASSGTDAYPTAGTPSGDLLWAITQANANTNTAGSVIEFDPTIFSSSNPPTITLISTLELSETAGPEVVQGPGAESATISGNDAVGVFQVESGVTATMSGLTISGGTALDGAGIDNSGSLTVAQCGIVNNSASLGGASGFGGGGIASNGTLTVNGCTIVGNAGETGGGLSVMGTATVTGCAIANNTALVNGGGGIANYGAVTVVDTTLSGNKAGGGGAIINSDFGGDTLTVVNSTIADNSVTQFGGGIANNPGDTVTIDDSNIAYNTSDMSSNGGGGLWDYTASAGATMTLNNTIVALNTDPNGADDIGGAALSSVSAYNLIGTGGAGGLRAGVNNNLVGVSATLLGAIQNNGGPTETVALLPGSAAIGAGTEVSGVTTDQRGEPLDSPPDIGAFQSQGFTLTVAANSAPQQCTDGIAFADPLTINVTANNPLEPVAGGTVTFTAPTSGPSAALAAGTATIATDGSASVIAADNSIAGTYIVTASTAGAAAPKSFSLTNLISAPVLNYTVNSTSGGLSGAGTSGTLPYVTFLASADANPSTNGNVIGFDPSVFATPQTITLSATLILSGTGGPEVIQGPGANTVMISGNNAVGVFQVDSGTTATVTGLTISGGSANFGGGIYNVGALTVMDCTVEDNLAGFGGGIANESNLTLTVTDCAVENNVALMGGGIGTDAGLTVVTDSMIENNSANGYGGGGIFLSDSTVTVTDSTIDGNTTDFRGGGIENQQSQLTVTNSTIADNKAVSLGGGVASTVGGAVRLLNSAIIGNSANYGGGCGGSSSGSPSSMAVTNCTIAGNAAENGGGIYVNGGALTIADSTLAENDVNSGGNGGGLEVAAGPATLSNTIVALNTNGDGATADNIAGVVSPASAYDLIGTAGAGGLTNGSNGNLIGVTNPGLTLTPVDNGGPTQTLALLPGSPAIDAGNNDIIPSGVTTDQRGEGFPRIANDIVDIGAFEAQQETTTTVTGSPAISVSGQSVTFTVTVTTRTGSAIPIPTGSIQFEVDGGDLGSPVALVNGSATSATISSLSIASHTVSAIYTSSTADFMASTGSTPLTVEDATVTNIQSVVNNAPSASGGSVTIETTSSTAVSTAVQAVNAAAPSSPVTVTLDLGGGTYTTDTQVSAQPDVTLIIQNGTLVGGSPARRRLRQCAP